MARSENHVLDRLRRVEADLAHVHQLRSDVDHLRHDIARLLTCRDNVVWFMRSAFWLGCAMAAHGTTGTLGRFFSELSKLLGRGLV